MYKAYPDATVIKSKTNQLRYSYRIGGGAYCSYIYAYILLILTFGLYMSGIWHINLQLFI